MRLLPWCLLVFFAACSRTSGPDAGPGRPIFDPDPPSQRRACDASKRPKPPKREANTRALCEALGGTWAGEKDALESNVECVTLGRGNRRCVGCVELPTTDVGARCEFDWDCQGTCSGGACAKAVKPHDDFGCRDRCIDGVVKRMCME